MNPEEINPEVTAHNLLDIQVCVPATFTDDEVRAFAERECPCGTDNGWQVRRQGSERLAGCDERVQCESRPEYVHIMLEA